MILKILTHVILWVAILVIAHLVFRKIMSDGWRSLYRDPLKALKRATMKPRDTSRDPTVWDHLDD